MRCILFFLLILLSRIGFAENFKSLHMSRDFKETGEIYYSFSSPKQKLRTQSIREGTWEIQIGDLPNQKQSLAIEVELAPIRYCGAIAAHYRFGSTWELTVGSVDEENNLLFVLKTAWGGTVVHLRQVSEFSFEGEATINNESTSAILTFRSGQSSFQFQDLDAVINGQPLDLPDQTIFRDPLVSNGIGTWVRHPSSDRFFACYRLNYPDGQRSASVYSYDKDPYFLLLYTALDRSDGQIAAFDKGESFHIDRNRGIGWIKTQRASVLLLSK